jgi:hypothetical protein
MKYLQFCNNRASICTLLLPWGYRIDFDHDWFLKEDRLAGLHTTLLIEDDPKSEHTMI